MEFTTWLRIGEAGHPLARMFHESPATTADSTVLHLQLPIGIWLASKQSWVKKLLFLHGKPLSQ